MDNNSGKVWHFSSDTPDSYAPDIVFNYVYQDKKRVIWAGSWVGGLISCEFTDNRKLKYKNYMPDKSDPESISYQIVTCIFQDSRGVIWVATKGGGLNKITGYDEIKHTGKLMVTKPVSLQMK
jgi:ligand-binding sensor domain-containing protein